MKLKDLRNLDQEHMLSFMGLETKASTAVWFFRTLGVLAVGALVGAGVALMLTPKSGGGLREDLREGLRRAPEEIKEVVASITTRVSEQAGPSA